MGVQNCHILSGMGVLRDQYIIGMQKKLMKLDKEISGEELGEVWGWSFRTFATFPASN